MQLHEPLLASALAARTGARLLGEDQPIRGVNEIHRVEAGDLTFVDHPKYYANALRSRASVILIDQEQEPPSGKTLLVAPEPFAIYDALVREHRPPYTLIATIDRSADVHGSAIVEPGAIIGPKVTVGAYTRVQANAVVYGPARIGAHVLIGAGTVVGDLAFYFRREAGAFRRWTTGGNVVIEDHVEIGPQCNIARGVGSTTRIGAGTKVDAQCHIGHGTRIGKNCLLAAQVGISGKVTLEDGVVLYGQVGVGQNVTIGAGAVVLGRGGVTKSLPGGKTYNGNPAQEARTWLRELAALRRLGKGS